MFSLEKKRLVNNFISLSVLQLANYVLPFVTIPYLVRVIGPENFGIIAFSQAITQYFIILTDYGFNLSATRKIAINRDKKHIVSTIYSSVLAAKFILLLLSLLILSLLLSFCSKINNHSLIFIYSFGSVIGNVLLPIWLFQGMERMKYITILNVLAKSFFTVLIFVVVKDQSDYCYIPIINSLGFIVAGLLGIYISLSEFKISFAVPSIRSVYLELKDGWNIFISTFAISFFTVANTFILGIVASDIVVGYYSAGEKIIRALASITVPICQGIFPYFSKLSATSEKQALQFLGKIQNVVGAFMLLITFLLIMFADRIVMLALGEQFTESINVVRIMSILPFTIFINNLYGTQIMLNFNMQKERTTILIIASVCNVILSCLAAPYFKHIGVASVSLLVELYVCIAFYIGVSRKGYKIPIIG